MFITGIERLPRKKNKIYIDDEYAFMLYDRDMALYHLTEAGAGRKQEDNDCSSDGFEETAIEISDELYEKIMKETVIRRAHQKTVALLERMDRTETELRRKMKLDLYSDAVADETIDWLKSMHYLDDMRYAQSYIRGHIGGTSRQELVTKLLSKGIAKDTINEAYSICCEESSFSVSKNGSADSNDQDSVQSHVGNEDINIEKQAAVKSLRKKLGSKKVLTPKERISAIGYMLRKGFRRNDIISAFDELGISIDYESLPD
ncbi:MAG: regulatory protein RecX [Lachnospiraceae bacterium]|nr:regulatory protein RecX [Lachnospiraceae bacterium]